MAPGLLDQHKDNTMKLIDQQKRALRREIYTKTLTLLESDERESQFICACLHQVLRDYDTYTYDEVHADFKRNRPGVFKPWTWKFLTHKSYRIMDPYWWTFDAAGREQRIKFLDRKSVV